MSAPILAALFRAIRREAPTNLRRAGATLGLASGAAAAAVYALACTENAPAFVLIWYSPASALVTGVGAMLGQLLLRW